MQQRNQLYHGCPSKRADGTALFRETHPPRTGLLTPAGTCNPSAGHRLSSGGRPHLLAGTRQAGIWRLWDNRFPAARSRDFAGKRKPSV